MSSLKGGKSLKQPFPIDRARRAYHRTGKTPPRLLQDLNLYNPDRLPTSLYNVLTELAFPYEESTAPPRTTAKGACKHRWFLQPKACTAEAFDPSQPGLAIVAGFCTRCRCHVSLEVDSRGEGQGVKPCPTPENPLHHFRYIPKRSQGFQRTSRMLEQWDDTRLFQCSAQACSARLTVRLRSSRLRKDFVDLLTDKSRIEARARRAMASDPDRFEGHAVPSPLDVLTNLRSYIGTAMKGDFRHIPANNKKWLLSLGEDCAALLYYLDFTKSVRLHR